MTLQPREAHQSGDGVQIMHCPMCGSGQVIGRSDGNTECQFCNQSFLVRVQPMYSAFPQSVDGMPMQIPGMPPPAPAPGMGGGMGMPPGADGAPPEDGADAGAGAPPFGADAGGDGGPPQDDGGDDSGEDSDSGGGAPPFGKSKKSSYYRTSSGQVLVRTAYLRYLAGTLKGAR